MKRIKITMGVRCKVPQNMILPYHKNNNPDVSFQLLTINNLNRVIKELL